MKDSEKGMSLLSGRKSRAKRVLVGMTGGVSSSVVAFLLKNQGFEVYGASLSLVRKGCHNTPCHVDGEDQVEAVCERLGIPLERINAWQEFEEGVLDLAMAARLEGRFFSTCISCQQVKLDVLWRRACEINCPWIATGHFAKLKMDPARETMEVCAFNSQKDQSHLLSRLPQEHLKNLLLPLGDLTEEMILDLTKHYGIEPLSRAKRRESCFFTEDLLMEMIEKKTDPSLKKPIYLVSSADQVVLEQAREDSPPLYRYHLGMEGISPSRFLNFPRNMVVTKLCAEKNFAVLGNREELQAREVAVGDISFYSGFDLSRPQLLGLKFESGPRLSGMVFLKNNEVARVELSAPLYNKGHGHVVTFYSGLEKNAKVVASGVVMGDYVFD